MQILKGGGGGRGRLNNDWVIKKQEKRLNQKKKREKEANKKQWEIARKATHSEAWCCFYGTVKIFLHHNMPWDAIYSQTSPVIKTSIFFSS